MKKTLFIFSLALAAMTANAQTRQVATISTYKPADLESVLYCVSANGRYAAGDFGAVSLLDLETGEETVFYEQANEGSTAKGVTNDGTIVGQYGVDLSSPGAVLKKGASKWEILPVPEDCNPEIEFCPQGVTPDGKYIAGYAYNTVKGMYIPVMWTLQDDGSYSVEVLPYPETDLWGMQPQMTVCYGLSNDGTRAYGMTRDYTGFCTLGILFKKTDGEWKYQVIGEDWLIHGTENPGPQPKFEDYVTAEEGTEEYWAQSSDYDLAVFDWLGLAGEYANMSITPANQISVNQNSMSGNGKWMVMATPEEVRLYNVDDGTYKAIPQSDGSVGTSVTNNGDVVMASPISMPVRSAYICPYSENMEGTSGLMKWLRNNYDVQYAEGTTGIEGLGTCCVTPDGTTFVGFNSPQEVNMWYVSTVVQIGKGGSTSIKNIETTKQPTIENGVLYIPEGEGQVGIYNTDGTQIANFTAKGSVDLNPYADGLVIVKVNVEKLTKTFKITL